MRQMKHGSEAYRSYWLPVMLVVFLAAGTVSGCGEPGSVRGEEQEVDARHPLVGTWQLVEWRFRDSLGNWQRPLGSDPRGGVVYAPSGHLSIQVMHEAGRQVSDCKPGSDEADLNALLDLYCYFGYFGTYEIRNDSVVVHKPTGGTLLSYIGTDQPRSYEVRGDSLWLERSERVYRLLLRVR